MSAMEFMSGGPPAPPGEMGGGGDLASLLGAGPTPGVDDPQQGGSELDALDAILMSIDDYIAIPTVSEQERLQAEQMKTMAQKLKADNEKMADEISGENPAMRKSLGA